MNAGVIVAMTGSLTAGLLVIAGTAIIGIIGIIVRKKVCKIDIVKLARG